MRGRREHSLSSPEGRGKVPSRPSPPLEAGERVEELAMPRPEGPSPEQLRVVTGCGVCGAQAHICGPPPPCPWGPPGDLGRVGTWLKDRRGPGACARGQALAISPLSTWGPELLPAYCASVSAVSVSGLRSKDRRLHCQGPVASRGVASASGLVGKQTGSCARNDLRSSGPGPRANRSRGGAQGSLRRVQGLGFESHDWSLRARAQCYGP